MQSADGKFSFSDSDKNRLITAFRRNMDKNPERDIPLEGFYTFQDGSWIPSTRRILLERDIQSGVLLTLVNSLFIQKGMPDVSIDECVEVIENGGFSALAREI